MTATTTPTPQTRTSHLRRPLALASALLLATTACGAGSHVAEDTVTPLHDTSTAAVPTGLERYYSQTPTWKACTGTDAAPGTQCATLTVPLDYAHPDGATINLALTRRPADGDGALGSLVVNPGGPGESGTQMVATVDQFLPSAVLNHYTVVGFDPRGVGQSTPITCPQEDKAEASTGSGTGSGASAANGTGEGDTKDTSTQDEELAAVQTDMTERAHACEADTRTATGVDGLLDHVDTVSAARDMDVLRAVLKERRLTYLGYSYGTFLGATYAQLFPANAGRMVLDGAVDPSLSYARTTLDQARAFERALRAYTTACQADTDCPLTGSTDAGIQQLRGLLTSLADKPLPTSHADRTLTSEDATQAVIAALYQSEAWTQLTEGLRQAIQDKDGTGLLDLADLMGKRDEDGASTSNSADALLAVNCLDYAVTGDATTWKDQATELKQTSPTFGSDLAYPEAQCQAWGHHGTQERTTLSTHLDTPALVIGTTGDPATPYEWAQGLATQLGASGRLLTVKGEGHTAYGRFECVAPPVNAYLLRGTVPEEGFTCDGGQ